MCSLGFPNKRNSSISFKIVSFFFFFGTQDDILPQNRGHGLTCSKVLGIILFAAVKN